MAYCHDAFVNEELEYYELLGVLCRGRGREARRRGRDGTRRAHPVQHRRRAARAGAPGWADGTAMLHEAVLQLRGEAEGRQVEDARVALTHLVGGGSIATVNLLGWRGADHDDE